ncbi:MAG: hypothetical protein ACRDHW_21250, partial [Ktedonobacteraceae bacterium]
EIGITHFENARHAEALAAYDCAIQLNPAHAPTRASGIKGMKPGAITENTLHKREQEEIEILA